MITKLKKTPNIDYQYYVEIESESTRGEDDGTGIFRGGQIISTDVTSFSKMEISDLVRSKYLESLHNQIKAEKAQAVKQAKAEAKAKKVKYIPLPKVTLPKFSDMDIYGIDRIVMNTPFSLSHFDVGTCGGYYGEEISSVSLDWKVESEMFDKIKKYLSTTDLSERIKMLLSWEYGYIPEILEEKTASVKKVSLDKVKMSGVKLDQYVKLDQETIAEYVTRFNNKAYTLKDSVPMGILLEEEDGFYRVVDGKHQLSAALAVEKKSASFIVMS